MADSDAPVPCPYADSLFRQQDMPATRPFLTPFVGFIVYGCLAIFSLTFGIASYSLSENVFERVIPYGELCGSNATCNVTLSVPKDVDGPLYVYYRLTNFYQSTFLFSASKNWNQLRGKPFTSVSALDSCKPLVGDLQDPDRPFVPCGMLPHSIFNDTFSFPPEFPELYDNDTAQTKFQELFKPPDSSYDSIGVSWLNPEIFPDNQTDDRFVTWLELAPFPEFRKLWAQTEPDAVVAAGDYTITIDNNFPVDSYGGTKSLLVAQVCWIGGQNPFFGIAFLVVMGASAIAALLLLALYVCKVLPLYRVFEERDPDARQRSGDARRQKSAESTGDGVVLEGLLN